VCTIITLYPIPYTLYTINYTLYSIPYTLYSTPYILYPISYKPSIITPITLITLKNPALYVPLTPHPVGVRPLRAGDQEAIRGQHVRNTPTGTIYTIYYVLYTMYYTLNTIQYTLYLLFYIFSIAPLLHIATTIALCSF
jgi:hypothetical protein